MGRKEVETVLTIFLKSFTRKRSWGMILKGNKKSQGSVVFKRKEKLQLNKDSVACFYADRNDSTEGKIMLC